MKKQKSLKSNKSMKYLNPNLMQEGNRKTKTNNVQIVQNIYVENFGSSVDISKLISLFLSSVPLFIITLKLYQIFDIDFEINLLSSTYISLIIYWLLNLCKDALFTFFS